MKNNLEQDRRDKLEYLTARGADPYAVEDHGYTTHKNIPITPIDEVRASFKPEFTRDDGPLVSVAGRIALMRGHGKLQFLTITSDRGQIQVALDDSRFQNPVQQRWDQMYIDKKDLGDIVLVRGRLCSTQRGEITIWADCFQIVSKALAPPPDKVNGLSDPELRYRLRHVDMWTNPDTVRVLQQRSRILYLIRDFMHGRGFLEVETPAMQPSAGGAIAKPFVTHHNALNIDLYLRIAPELYLKRLLVGGMTKIFEIGKNFRNEGISPRHNPEFTSLEAYEAYGNAESMMRLVEAMIVHVVQNLHGSLEVPYKGAIINFTPPFNTVTLQELVPGDKSPEYRQKVYEDSIEPGLLQPTFVRNFPVSAVPLAKPFGQYQQNHGYADVFELAIGGMEIAPGYSESNNPDIQLAALQSQAANGHILDQDFIDALKVGMPPAGGLGLGIDRLVAILTDQPTIRDVIPFPVLRPKD